MKATRILLRLLLPLATLAIAAGSGYAGMTGEVPTASSIGAALADVTLVATDSTGVAIESAAIGDGTLQGLYAPMLGGGFANESSHSANRYLTSGLAVAMIAAPAIFLSQSGGGGDPALPIGDAARSEIAPITLGGSDDEPVFDPPPLDLTPIEPPSPGLDAPNAGPEPDPGNHNGAIPEPPVAALIPAGVAALALSLRRLG